MDEQSRSPDEQAHIAALVDVAKKMIAGELGPIAGARKILELQYDVGDSENDVFLPFVGIWSEADTLVVGDRSLFADEYLERVDREYADYDERLRPSIGDCCRALLDVFEPRLT